MSETSSAWLRRALRWCCSPTGVLVFAVLFRIAFIVQMGNRFYFADTAEYEDMAMRLLHGHAPGGLTPRAPLYPALMALGFLVGGAKNYAAVRLIEVVLSIVDVVLCARIARRLGGPSAELLAIIGAACAPTLIFTSGMLYPTILYSTCLLAATVLALELPQQPGLARGALFGLVVTLGWLTDQVIAAPVLAIAAWQLAQLRRGGGAYVRALLAAGVVALLIAVPYLIVQRQHYGSRAVFMQKAQFVLYWSRSDSTMDRDRQVRIPADSTFRPLPTHDFLAQEWHLLSTQPGGYVHDVAFEFLHFFQPMPDRVQTQNRYNQPYVLLLGAIYFVPILLLFIIGLLGGPGPWRERLLIALVVMATAAFYSLFFTQTRYRIPVEPQMIALAAAALSRLFPRLAALLAGGRPPSWSASPPVSGRSGGR